ncbi:MAG: c-type cytochrome [Flavobacteriaceae bacterium]|nr:c-type cytochrome [Flavobacteriaceae bacterium]
MNKMFLTLTIITFILSSCGESKKEEVKKEVIETKEVKIEEPTTGYSLFAQGEKLFNDKTCISCHQLNTKIVGPSIKKIASIYEEKNGNLMDFLEGKSEPIVDSDPGQVAIMKANLDGFVKDLSVDQLKALENYILNAK